MINSLCYILFLTSSITNNSSLAVPPALADSPSAVRTTKSKWKYLQLLIQLSILVASKSHENCMTWIPWKLVLPSRFISWKTHFLILAGSGFYQIWWGRLTDCTYSTGQFRAKMKANAKPRLLSSLVWIDSGIIFDKIHFLLISEN